jgi:SAM-dependent methyltransferase
MTDQARSWSRAAEGYEERFIDPYREGTRNPLREALVRLGKSGGLTAADLGCGIGPLLPLLAQHFQTVFAVDFAEGMLARARERCGHLANVRFVQTSLTDLGELASRVDVAVAVNSLVMPDIRDLEKSLSEVRLILRPGGRFLGIVPAIDAVHYHTMLLIDRALKTGMPMDKARQNAARHGEHELYDFAFGQFHYRGLQQHFWQPFEVGYRLRRAGFRRIRLSKVLLAWDQFSCAAELKEYPPPWDWFFQAERPPS